MQRFINQWLRHRLAFIFVAVPIVMAFVGPFGTYSEMGFARRLLYWSVLCCGIGALMYGCIVFVLRVRTHRIVGMLPRIVLGATLAAVPGTILVLGMHALMREPETAPTLMRYARIWAQVSFVGIVVSLIELARVGPPPEYKPDSIDDDTETDTPPEETPRLSDFHKRLVADHGARPDILSLSMQDHYVEVTSDAGTTMILMRFADALKELNGVPGVRVHRSHWVATAHISGLRRSGHRAWVRLSDGRELPVSQTYLDAVRAVTDVSVSAP